jgi:membrane protease YdiL (CAAX protease family)
MLVETPLTEASDLLLEFLRVPHPEQETVESFRQFNAPSLIFLFMFQAVIFNPIVEELFFRGFLLTFLKNYTTPLFAIVLSGGIFAFAHLNLGAALPLWFLGIALGVAYEHTGSLVLPMAIHGCFNLATGLSLLLERGTSS